MTEFIEWGRIHTAECMEHPVPDPWSGVGVGERESGCICDGIPLFIRVDDVARSPERPS